MDPTCLQTKHKSFDFLGLPGELRNRIYKECIWSQLVPGTDRIRRSNYNNLVAFFTTNKQIRDELMPLVFESVVLCHVDPDMTFYLPVVRGLDNIRKAHPNLQGCLTVYENSRVHRYTQSWSLEPDDSLRFMLIASLCSGYVDNYGSSTQRSAVLYFPQFLDFQHKRTGDFTIHCGVPAHLKDKVRRSTARSYPRDCSYTNGQAEWTYEASDGSWYIVARWHDNHDVELIGNIACLHQLWDRKLSRVEERKYQHVTDAFRQRKQLRRKWELKIQTMGAIPSSQQAEVE